VSELILHVTSRADWSAAMANGQYSADSLAGQGFIHCSRIAQVLRVADVFYSGVHGLVLLVIDPGRLTSELRWEPGTDLATELFPHIYGPLNLEAVLQVIDFEPGADGKVHLPASLVSSGRA
jgi:uncharacterized protein (DUF952 family)